MLTVLVVIAVLAVLFGAAALATHDGELLADPAPDRHDVALPDGPLQPEDVAEVRFGMALRGYRMDEVDRVLARLATELTRRDARIAELEQGLVDLIEPALAEAEQAVAGRSAEAEAEPATGQEAPLAVGVTDQTAPSPTAVHAPLTAALPVQPAAEPATPEVAAAAGDDAFGFPEVLPPDAAQAGLPDATEDPDAAGDPDPEPEPLPAPHPEPLPEPRPEPRPEPGPEPLPAPMPGPEPLPETEPIVHPEPLGGGEGLAETDAAPPLGQPGEGFAGEAAPDGPSPDGGEAAGPRP